MGLLEGMVMGFGIKTFSNLLRKEPMMKAPWEHVIAVGVFGWLGKKYSEEYIKMRHTLYEELEMFERHSDGVKWHLAEEEAPKN